MRKNYADRYKQTAFKKWMLLITTLLIILFIGLFAYLYVIIIQDKNKGFSQTETKVLEQTEIIHVTKIERFHDEKYYHVVHGENEKGEQMIAFVPQVADEAISTIHESEMITEEQLIEQWAKSCHQCKKIKATPALIENNPYWELTYYNEEDQYVISYYEVDSFELVEQLTLYQMFN